MKKALLLVLSICIIFVLFGCNNEVPSEDGLSSLQEENEKLKEKNIVLEEEIITYKERMEELEQSQNSPIPDTTETNDDIRNLLFVGQKRFFHVSSGGDMKDYETFDYNGKEYRFLGEDLDQKDKLTQYLEEAYTLQAVNEILNKLKIIELNDKMAQPDADFGSILEWRKVNYQGIELDKTTIILNLHVPLGDTGQFEEERVELKYIEGIGWRINSLLYLNNK
ncbi:DL-endopeptidase inhibitor IseA family protein [Evansella sp. AB-rgal1]|uniref:DL-endopeptidase inhibitor IseA family protein n=1 Tax=Evansella sp. AB-rgal1 TaxID=3242696 RepID=UPI00359E1A89